MLCFSPLYGVTVEQLEWSENGTPFMKLYYMSIIFCTVKFRLTLCWLRYEHFSHARLNNWQWHWVCFLNWNRMIVFHIHITLEIVYEDTHLAAWRIFRWISNFQDSQISVEWKFLVDCSCLLTNKTACICCSNKQ